MILRWALTEAIKEAIWIRGIKESFGLKSETIFIHCYSQSSIITEKNPMYHEITKHIDAKLYFIRDVVA